MKRTLVVLGILAMFALPTFAQDLVTAGSIFIEGGSGLGFDYFMYTFEPDVEGADSYDESEMNLDLYGKMGYFVIDGLAVGPILNVGYNSYTPYDIVEDEAGDPITTMTYGFGIWGGYYFDLGSAFLPYVALGFLLDGYNQTIPGDDEDYTVTGMMYGPALWAGGLISFAEGWALNLGLDFEYLFGTYTYGDGEDVDVDRTTMDISFDVGLLVFL